MSIKRITTKNSYKLQKLLSDTSYKNALLWLGYVLSVCHRVHVLGQHGAALPCDGSFSCVPTLMTSARRCSRNVFQEPHAILTFSQQNYEQTISFLY